MAVAQSPAPDWHFLLPTLPHGSVLCLGGAGPRASIGPPLSPKDGAEGGGDPLAQYDLVALLHPAPRWALNPAAAATLARIVRPGGTLYLEVPRRIGRTPTGMVRTLRRSGFSSLRCYWPRQGFERPDLWLELGHRRVNAYYARQMVHTGSLRRRAVGAFLRVAIAGGVFEALVPGYAVVAVRAGDDDAR